MKNDNRILVGIPTRDRPEYLSCLLSSLIFQEGCDFDVLVVDTTVKDSWAQEHPMVERFVGCAKSYGIKVYFIHLPTLNRSEVGAINYIINYSSVMGYKYLYKIDDDHILPPGSLSLFSAVYSNLSVDHDKIILCGMNPWMYSPWDGASSPEDDYVSAEELEEDGVTSIELIEDRDGIDIKFNIGHFNKSKGKGPVKSHIGSAANFFMVPDVRLFWTELGSSSKYADVVWYIQLRKWLGYSVYFIPEILAWHVAAPGGGVRVDYNNFEKESSWDVTRKLHLIDFLEKMNAD